MYRNLVIEALKKGSQFVAHPICRLWAISAWDCIGHGGKVLDGFLMGSSCRFLVVCNGAIRYATLGSPHRTT